MPVHLWCLLAAIILPYVWAIVSATHRKKEFGTADNNHPREQAAKATGPGARAYAAQANAWEALAVFAPCIRFAHIQNPSSGIAPMLAFAWVGLRTLHGVAYVANIAPLRSALFSLAQLCSVGLFLIGAKLF